MAACNGGAGASSTNWVDSGSSRGYGVFSDSLYGLHMSSEVQSTSGSTSTLFASNYLSTLQVQAPSLSIFEKGNHTEGTQLGQGPVQFYIPIGPGETENLYLEAFSSATAVSRTPTPAAAIPFVLGLLGANRRRRNVSKN